MKKDAILMALNDHYRLTDLLLLAAAFAVVIYLRYSIVFSFTYPPGSDGAGDIIISKSMLSRGISYPETVPPFYYVSVMITTLQFLSPPLSIKFLITLIPALIVFPSYFILRDQGCNRLFSIMGAFLLAYSAAFSLMISWNSAYNIFGIFLMLFYLLFILRYLKQKSNSNLILSAVFFTLVAATHELTFLIAVVTTIFIFVAHLWSRRNIIALIDILKYLGVALAFSSILIPVYIYNILILANLGAPSSSLQAIQFKDLVLQGLFFAWGYQGGTYFGYNLVTFSVILSLISVCVMFIDPERRYAAFTFLGIMVGSYYFSEIDPSNYTRGYYFMAIPLILSIFLLAQISYDHIEEIALSIAKALKRLRYAHFSRAVEVSLTIIIAVVLVMVTVNEVEVSSQNLMQGEKYYQVLDNSGYEASLWMKANLPSNATFFSDSLGLWPGAISGLSELSPSVLGAKVTKSSYRSALLTDYLYLGNYLLENANFIVIFNSPYFFYPLFDAYLNGFWYPLLYYEANHTSLVFLDSTSQVITLNLSAATLLNITETWNNSRAFLNSTYSWHDSGMEARETILESGNNVSVSWSSQNDTLLNVRNTFYFNSDHGIGTYNLSSAHSNNTVSLLGTTFDINLNLYDGSMAEYDMRNSTYLFLNSSEFQFSLNSKSFQQFSKPIVYDTIGLAREMNISYFLVNRTSDSQMYYRLLYMNQTFGASTKEVYNNGNYQIFSISYITRT